VLARDAIARHPDLMDEVEDLLNLPRPKRQVSEIAILGGHEDDLTIAGGYLRVAEIAARHWITHGPDDGLPIPILFNYRHGIELTLKWLIRPALELNNPSDGGHLLSSGPVPAEWIIAQSSTISSRESPVI